MWLLADSFLSASCLSYGQKAPGDSQMSAHCAVASRPPLSCVHSLLSLSHPLSFSLAPSLILSLLFSITLSLFLSLLLLLSHSLSYSLSHLRSAHSLSLILALSCTLTFLLSLALTVNTCWCPAAEAEQAAHQDPAALATAHKALFRALTSGFGFWFCHLLAVSPWTSRHLSRPQFPSLQNSWY